MADSQKKLIILPDNPLCGIKTYKDTLNLATGACTRQIKSKVIPPDYSTITATAITNGTRFEISFILGTNALPNQGICTHAVYSTGWNTFNAFSISRTNGHIYMARTDISTVEEFRAWLADQSVNGTPVTVWYVLATPTTETITVPSGLTGTEEGYLNQSGTPTPTNPIYPTANNVEVWLHSLRKLTTSTDTITTLPAVLYPNAVTATVGLKGQAVQSSTPSPTSPVMPQGTGDKTANLSTIYSPNISSSGGMNFEGVGDKLRLYGDTDTYVQCINTNNINLAAGTYTISASSTRNNSVCYVQFRSEDGTSTYATIPLNRPTTVTFNTAVSGRIRVICQVSTYYNTDEIISIMINEGSTPQSYEPSGYKIPILSNSTTTPVYLGEVESTRRIKKLVLDGSENLSASGQCFFITALDVKTSTSQVVIGNIKCTHYPATTFSNVYNGYTTGCGIPSNALWIAFHDSSISSLADFKTYLQQQYANGTPVTVWYVLATETTGIVNEPIRKIGAYADTVSGITIPTITGKDTFDVQTTLKPSEVELAYTGWHDATVKEWNGSQWS